MIPPDALDRPRAPAPATRRFGVVVPVKPPRVAKSRLAGLGDEVRRELVVAFVADTVDAVLGCAVVGSVLVVTDDVDLARGLHDLGVSAIPDGRPGDLNESLRQGAAELVRRQATLVPAAVCADLPCLRGADLEAALASAPRDRAAFVPDVAGVGTTLYTAPDWDGFQPRFGAGSRAAHLQAGAVELVAAESVRRDVDTPEDLEDARRVGLGPRSSLTLTRLGI